MWMKKAKNYWCCDLSTLDGPKPTVDSPLYGGSNMKNQGGVLRCFEHVHISLKLLLLFGQSGGREERQCMKRFFRALRRLVWLY